MSQRHQAYELKQYQSLPLDAKIRMTQQRIKQWYDHFDGAVYVSFSGGKDSTVLLHLVRSLYPDVPAVFSDTGLEFPEIRRFAMSQDNVTVVRPKMRFPEVIRTYGYPILSKEISEAIYYARRIKGGGTESKKMDRDESQASGAPRKSNICSWGGAERDRRRTDLSTHRQHETDGPYSAERCRTVQTKIPQRNSDMASRGWKPSPCSTKRSGFLSLGIFRSPYLITAAM